MTVLDLLVCPLCRGALDFEDGSACCAGCGATYPVEDGIPFLVPELDELKRRQAEWYDDEADPEYEIERPHGTPRFHAWLLGEKFRRSVRTVQPWLAGATVLSVCAGSGMDAEFLARAGARVIAADISPGAARRAQERARRHGVDVTPIVADVERLPFADASVDLVYVHDGLHHLGRPLAGLAEMARVARSAVSVTEPARAAATRLSVRIGYSGDVEEAGNRVERLLPGEVGDVLVRAGFEVTHSSRYAMVYRHVAGRPVRLLSARPLYPLARAGYRVANLLLGRVGNKLTVQAVRRDRPRRVLVHDFGGHPFPVQLSRELARRGDDVLHLYCPSYPNGRGPLERRAGDPQSFRSEPVPLGSALRKYSLLRRPLQELEYGRRIAGRIARFRPDYLLSANTPVIAQWGVQRAARTAGCRFVYWQQDLNGEAMAAIARVRLPLVGRVIAPLFPALEARLLRRSDAVVAISDGFVGWLTAHGVARERVRVIENWAPFAELPPHERENAWKRDLGLGGDRLVLYAGTLGLKHDVDLLWRLAEEIAASDARLLVASEGAGADVLASRLARQPLEALVLLPFQPYERLPEMLGAADVLVALLGRDLGAYSVPSKVLTYHCAGRPIVAAMPSENPSARLIVEAGSGLVVEPSDVSGLVAATLRLLDDATLARTCGARARAFAERAFDVAAVADDFEAALDGARAPTRAVEPIRHRLEST